MLAVIVRIALRYGAGLLVAKGLLAPDAGIELANDVDVQAAIEVGLGLAMAGASELWMVIARRCGWAT